MKVVFTSIIPGSRFFKQWQDADHYPHKGEFVEIGSDTFVVVSLTHKSRDVVEIKLGPAHWGFK